MAQITVDDIIAGFERFEKQIPDLLANIASLAKTRLSSSATTKFMKSTGARDAISGLGRNPQTGIGTLRIDKGRLARSLTGTKENISDASVRNGLLTYIFGSEVDYARVNEKGFSGNVNVSQHVRTITQAFGRDIAPRQVTVSAHSRNMRIPARPYLNPALDDQADFLAKEINRRIYNALLAA